MDPSSLSLLLLLSISSASAHRNGSLVGLRTFSGQPVVDQSDPADYLDPSWMDDGGSGSAVPQQPVKKHLHDGQKLFFVSEEARRFLQSRLATIFVPTLYTLVFVVSVPLNAVAVVMFVLHIRPKKPAAIYMLNLASADLLFGLLLPFKVAYHYLGNHWIFGSPLCRVVTAAFYCNMYCSVLLMTCISVDRLLAVVYPIHSLSWRSSRAASAVCVSMWLLALVGAAPLLVSEQTAYLPELDITTCHDVQDLADLQTFYQFFFPIYSCVFFFIPLVLTASCYVRVISVLAATNVQNRSRKKRAVVMAVMVLLVFVVCFTPTNVILVIHYVQLSTRPSDWTYRAYLISLCVGSIGCCLDPVLYYFGSSQCQKQVMALLRGRRLGPTVSSSSTRSRKTVSSMVGTTDPGQNGLAKMYHQLAA
ncbi:proteinase-activated receptor 1 [Neosynchiropus ocellatus]